MAGGAAQFLGLWEPEQECGALQTQQLRHPLGGQPQHAVQIGRRANVPAALMETGEVLDLALRRRVQLRVREGHPDLVGHGHQEFPIRLIQRARPAAGHVHAAQEHSPALEGHGDEG